jgi:hypothetical protein
MLAAIDFDDQSRFKTNKVDDVWTDRKLPTKRETLKAVCTQSAPNLTFGFRHVAAKRASPRPLKG